jgi:hypothetical protein
MKRCPVCGNTYTDKTLRFCLTDGSELTEVEQETVVRSARPDPLRVDIAAREDPPKPPAPQPSAGSLVFKILLAIVILGVLVVAAAGIVLAVIYYNSTGPGTDQNAKTPSPIPTASPTIDPEKQRLQDELANIQKKLDEQKNANRPSNAAPFPTPGQSGVVTARVNSAADGFLALRSEPDSEYGERLAKIPHGTVVTLEDCQRERVKIGNRTGRWCMVTYAGKTGWVFDAWLDY